MIVYQINTPLDATQLVVKVKVGIFCNMSRRYFLKNTPCLMEWLDRFLRQIAPNVIETCLDAFIT